jgi:hypothetical protein
MVTHHRYGLRVGKHRRKTREGFFFATEKPIVVDV